MLQVALAVRQKRICYVLTQLGLIATPVMVEAEEQQQHYLGRLLPRRTTVVEMEGQLHLSLCLRKPCCQKNAMMGVVAALGMCFCCLLPRKKEMLGDAVGQMDFRHNYRLHHSTTTGGEGEAGYCLHHCYKKTAPAQRLAHRH